MSNSDEDLLERMQETCIITGLAQLKASMDQQITNIMVTLFTDLTAPCTTANSQLIAEPDVEYLSDSYFH